MRIRIFVCFLLLGYAIQANAEQVDIFQAVEEAIEERPGSRAAMADSVAASEGVAAARSRYYPHLTLSENMLWTDEPGGSMFISLNQEELVLSQDADRYNFPPSRKDFETRISLDQPLYDPDISYGLRRAEAAAGAAMAMSRRTVEGAAFEAFRSFLDVQRSSGAMEWVEQSLREAQEIRRLAVEREMAGVGLKADRLRAEVLVAEAELRQVTAEKDLTLARRSLGLAMGRNPGDPEERTIELSYPLTPELFPLPPSQGMERGDVTALRMQAEESSLALRQSRAAWMPRAGLSALYSLHDDAPFGTDSGSWSVRTALSWTLFDGFSRSHQTARAESQRNAAVGRAEESRRQALYDMEKASLEAAEARSRLDLALRAREAAMESHALLTQRYEAGLAPLSDLLSAQSSLDRARYALINAQAGLVLALGNMSFQNGTFLKDLFANKETAW